MYCIKERDVIRVKVKYCDDERDPVIKKFAIDPRLTNYEVLIGLLVKGLNIKRDFIIYYLATDDFGEQFYLPLLSDWDLDAAILTASDPILRLKVNLKQKEKDLEEWDIVVPGEAPVKLNKTNLTSKNISNLFKSLSLADVKLEKSSSNSLINQFYSQMEKTKNSFQRVFTNNKVNESVRIAKTPMSDIEFRNYMDNIGRIVQPEEFRRSVYLGGLEPSLRKVGWRLLLNVYPVGLTGRERLNLLEKKSKHYRSLKHSWKQKFKQCKLSEQELSQIALVSVDVIRTDRSLNFYSGEKNHVHLAQLFDILATYCIYHPSVGYYQGMSDLASPILFVQGEEAVAYICFCSLMRRICCNFVNRRIEKDNSNHYGCKQNGDSSKYNNNRNDNENDFDLDHSNIMAKLQHLHDLVVYLDPEFAAFLRSKHLGNFYFAHRWILLEMKREFTFMDCLRLLEIQWACLPQCRYVGTVTDDGVPLVEKAITDSIVSGPLCPQHYPIKTGALSKVRCYAVRDMSLIFSLIGSQYIPNQSHSSSNPPTPSYSQLLFESFGNRVIPDNDCNLDFNPNFYESNNSQNVTFKFTNQCICHKSSSSSNGDLENLVCQKIKPDKSEFSDDEDDDLEYTNNNTHKRIRTISNSSANNDLPIQMKDGVVELPPPEELGHGNPFLLFLCVSLLQEYREVIMRGVAEPSDILLLFQKVSQKHNTSQIISRARSLFDQYLRKQEIRRLDLDKFPVIDLST